MTSGRVLVVGSLNADLVVRTPRIPGPGETALAFRLAAGDYLPQACRFAVRVGAYAATGKGAQNSYPTGLQLEDWRP